MRPICKNILVPKYEGNDGYSTPSKGEGGNKKCLIFSLISIRTRPKRDVAAVKELSENKASSNC